MTMTKQAIAHYEQMRRDFDQFMTKKNVQLTPGQKALADGIFATAATDSAAHNTLFAGFGSGKSFFFEHLEEFTKEVR